MVFSSSVFLLIFLPIVFVVNMMLGRKLSNLFLLCASLLFYAWGEPFFVLIMVLSIIINWLTGIAIENSKGVARKISLAVGIALNILLLGYYKYFGFLVAIVNGVCKKEIMHDAKVTLPIGISFFTFQAISYIADVYRGEAKASRNLVNVALYISFFPQLIAGPIVKYRDINEQLLSRKVSFDNTVAGFRRFIYGLAKKVLIANVLGGCVDGIYMLELSQVDFKMAWICSLAYTFQIYYDFSGYSDMAIGLAKMFGFSIADNFDYPYLSGSITEFWRKWHISLGAWFREYIYIPLGGNRKGKIRTDINLIVVFFLTGLWHGADLAFVVWGLYYGIIILIERNGLKQLLDKSSIISKIYCFFVVNLGWVLFRAGNISLGLEYLSKMFRPFAACMEKLPVSHYIDNKLIFVFICALAGMGILQRIVPKEYREKWQGSVVEACYCCVLLILSLAAIASNTYNPFIFFQF